MCWQRGALWEGSSGDRRNLVTLWHLAGAPGTSPLCPLLTPLRAGSSMYGYGDFDGPGFQALGDELVSGREPAHAILNIAVWQGDAAPPFEPPAPPADRRTVMFTARVNARRSMPPTRLRRQSMARTRTWTVSGTGIGRERSRQAARDRQRSEPVRRWANTHAAAERGPTWGIEGAESLASPCRGPAKRGPKG